MFERLRLPSASEILAHLDRRASVRAFLNRGSMESVLDEVFSDLRLHQGAKLLRSKHSPSLYRFLVTGRFALDLWIDEREHTMGGMIVLLEGLPAVDVNQPCCSLHGVLALRNGELGWLTPGREVRGSIRDLFQSVHDTLARQVPELFQDNDRDLRALVLAAGNGEVTDEFANCLFEG